MSRRRLFDAELCFSDLDNSWKGVAIGLQYLTIVAWFPGDLKGSCLPRNTPYSSDPTIFSAICYLHLVYSSAISGWACILWRSKYYQ